MEIPSNPNPYDYSAYNRREGLSNATATLVLGICTIILNLSCCCFPIGAVTGVIALVFGHTGRTLYRNDPDKYTENSYKNLNAGFICAIIGLALGIFICFIGFVMALTDPETMRTINREMKRH